mgnify:CR=1 FL=1
MNNHITARIIKKGTTRMNVALLALNWITDDKRKEYYSTLDKEDLPSNMESLFNDLAAIHDILIEGIMELEEYRSKFLKEESDV